MLLLKRESKVIIALDYDGTYTADPELWDGFIAAARARGHQVIICTMRHDTEPVDEALVAKVDRVVYTGRRTKCVHMSNLGIIPKIWIDDRPETILMGGT